MKIGICGARTTIVDKSIEYIGVDRGNEILVEQGIKPIMAIGDFDSIHDEKILSDLTITRLPTRKDVTDSHAALDYAISIGYDEIDIYGVTGGRLDHFLSALCLLEKYEDIKIRIIDEQNIIQLLKPGNHKIYKDEFKYFSLYALTDTILDIKGAHYPLDNYYLKRDDPLCVSNQVLDEIAIVNTTNSIILIKSRDS